MEGVMGSWEVFGSHRTQETRTQETMIGWIGKVDPN